MAKIARRLVTLLMIISTVISTMSSEMALAAQERQAANRRHDRSLGATVAATCTVLLTASSMTATAAFRPTDQTQRRPVSAVINYYRNRQVLAVMLARVLKKKLNHEIEDAPPDEIVILEDGPNPNPDVVEQIESLWASLDEDAVRKNIFLSKIENGRGFGFVFLPGVVARFEIKALGDGSYDLSLYSLASEELLLKGTILGKK